MNFAQINKRFFFLYKRFPIVLITIMAATHNAMSSMSAVLPDNQLRDMLVSKFVLLHYPFSVLNKSWWKPYLQPASIDIPIGTTRIHSGKNILPILVRGRMLLDGCQEGNAS